MVSLFGQEQKLTQNSQNKESMKMLEIQKTHYQSTTKQVLIINLININHFLIIIFYFILRNNVVTVNPNCNELSYNKQLVLISKFFSTNFCQYLQHRLICFSQK
jgi:hypothetical protein